MMPIELSAVGLQQLSRQLPMQWKGWHDWWKVQIFWQLAVAEIVKIIAFVQETKPKMVMRTRHRYGIQRTHLRI